MMNFNNITNLYIGGVEVQTLYINNSKVYDKSEPVETFKGLTFTAREANSTVSLVRVGEPPECEFQTSTNGTTWNDYVIGQTITLSNVDDKVYFRAKSDIDRLSNGDEKYHNFVMTGTIAASGNINSLISPDFETITSSDKLRLFYKLFMNCTSLTTSPTLALKSFGLYTYQYLFSGCSNLEKITLMYEGTLGDGNPASYGNPFYNWVDGVASEGTIYYDGATTTQAADKIPYGWTIKQTAEIFGGVVFTAKQANSTIAMSKGSYAPSQVPEVSLEYSTNGTTWNDFIVDQTTITLNNVGDVVGIRAKSTNEKIGSLYCGNKFVMSGNLSASGDITKLLDKSGNYDGSSSSQSTVLFSYLFSDCTSLTDVKNLDLRKITYVSNYSFYKMFSGSGITNLPKMPYFNYVNNSGMSSMFENCSSLVDASSYTINVSTTYDNALQNMFKGSGLVKSPIINVSSPRNCAMMNMFENCTSLTTVGKITVSSPRGNDSTFDGMFKGCTSLTTTPDLTGIPVENKGDNTARMFQNCTGLTRATIPWSSFGTTNPTRVLIGFFQGCSSLETINLPNYTGEINFSNWVDGVASSGTLYYDGPTTTQSVNQIPVGWTIMNAEVKFTAREENSTLKLNTSASLQYKINNGGWVSMPKTSIPITNVGDIIHVKASGTNSTLGGSNSTSVFSMTGSWDVGGDIAYLMSSTPSSQAKASQYRNLFTNCTGLIDASNLVLSHDNIGFAGYAFMFQGCTNLVEPPIISSTTTGYVGMKGMFKNCSSLTKSPILNVVSHYDLSGESTGGDDFTELFYGCSSLNEITTKWTGSFGSRFTNWVNGVASTGSFYYDGTDTTRGVSAIPTGWVVNPSEEFKGLTFTAREANSTISMEKVGDAPDVSLEYSTDNNTWNDFVVGETIINLANVDDTCKIRAKSTNGSFANDKFTYNNFVTTGSFDLSGEIMSLVDKDWNDETTIQDFQFCKLFYSNTSLVDVSELKFNKTMTTTYCYGDMFCNCSSLTNAGFTLECENCTGESHYGGMFNGCSSLTTPPEILAQNIDIWGLQWMFNGCTSLVKAPIMYGTSYASSAVYMMFKGCNSLNEIVFKNYTGDIYGYQWVSGVASSGDFYYDGPTTTRGANYIPIGWNIKPSASYGIKGVIFQAKQANSTISMTKVGDAPDISLEYTYDGETWYEFIVGETTITLENVGDVVGIRCNWGGNSQFNTDSNNRNTFVMSGNLKAIGDINYLIDYDATPSSWQQGMFAGLFYECEALTDVSNLIVRGGDTKGIFYGMFSRSGITNLPKLTSSPAHNAMRYMFDTCLGLTDLSSYTISAWNFSYQSMSYMFHGCSNMTKTPNITANGLFGNAAYGMFEGCTSLTTIGSLNFKVADGQSLCRMFRGCTSLTTPANLSGISMYDSNANKSFSAMFEGCTSLTSAIIPFDTIPTDGLIWMFNGCTNLSSIKLPNYVGEINWLNWVQNVASSGTIAYNGPTTEQSVNQIPIGWTIVQSTNYKAIKLNGFVNPSSSNFQLGRIEFVDESGNQFQYPSTTSTTVQNLTPYSNEGADKIINHSTSGKLCAKVTAIPFSVIIDVGDDGIDLNTFNKVQLFFANDSTNMTRLPTSFNIQTTTDRETWTTICEENSLNVSGSAYQKFYEATLTL